MRENDWGESVPETYEEAIALAAYGINMGSDDMANRWGPAMDFKLGEDYDDRVSEDEIEEAQCEVYIDILRAALGDYEARLVQLREDQSTAAGIAAMTELRTDEALDAAGVTATAGELIAHLSRFPADMPVTVAKPNHDWWLNIDGASDPRTYEEHSVILTTRDDFDPRQF